MKKRIYNQTALFGPLYAYLIVISPPQAVKEAIALIKKDLNQIAAISERNLHSIAHITLFDKLTDDADVAATVSNLIASHVPFTLKIKGWSVFDHGHSVTVYLDVKNTTPLTNLMAALKSPSRSPHISLAKKIPHATFSELLPYLENLDYTAEWTCSEVTVLRKLMAEKHLGFRESFKISLKKKVSKT